ncbi:S-adenosyl-L-methionine-dependent methyltransferase [Cyathus striatus]|nr:S-adenosyl-L-methionine-dependent methyltransferase [Cyathus striatus]
MHPRLLPRLAAAIGSHQASLEFAWMKHALSERPALSLPDMVDRRVRGEPLQYILGTQPFGPLNLLTRPPVLIPRPETEHWVMKLAENIAPTAKSPYNLLDLGTGSGCIPLLLCHLCPPGSLRAHGIDISPHAISLANDNAAQCRIPQQPDADAPKNTFKATLANFLPESFPDNNPEIARPIDVITSNPPYISWDEYLQLPRSVSAYEDPKALFGGPTGLDFYHAIARLIRRKDVLSSSAVVAMEVGHEQAETVEQIMRDIGDARRTEIWKDPWGKQRTVVVRM